MFGRETFTLMLWMGGRKTVVLVVGEDKRAGIWNFVLNHRKDYATGGAVSEMDWTNPCPTQSEYSVRDFAD
jgi:hypothetical protein